MRVPTLLLLLLTTLATFDSYAATLTATATPATVSVAIAYVSSPSGEAVVPITVSDLSGYGITHFEIAFAFNNEAAYPYWIDTAGTLSDGWSITTAAHHLYGYYAISATGTVPLSGSGTLLNMRWGGNHNVPMWQSRIDFLSWTDPSNIYHPACLFAPVSPPIALTNGGVSFSFLSPYTVTGTVTYGNAIGPPTPRFVSNVQLIGYPGQNWWPYVGATNLANGTYSLVGFGIYSDYTVISSKNGGVNGGITSFDSGKVAQHVAGVSSLAGNQLIVADVSGDGTISSFDAAQIARYVAGLNNNTGSTGNWKFIPASRVYAPVTTNITGEDFSALLMGEVSGNWTNTGAR